LGFCNRPPHIYLLMEFMPGGSLHAALFGSSAKRIKLPFAKKADMALQVAEGLTYLHSLSVVHRDLKTMNIILDVESNCKICDFGLTITLEKTHLTVRHMQGSPRYMAPEQFESSAKITEKVDIWQMGCVMLELFCHYVPFKQAHGVQQIATELLLKRRPPHCPAEADPRVRALIQACLRIDPKPRPWAAILVEALNCVLSSCEEADR
jgi:mitogen-activated protein kinase kinase kinase